MANEYVSRVLDLQGMVNVDDIPPEMLVDGKVPKDVVAGTLRVAIESIGEQLYQTYDQIKPILPKQLTENDPIRNVAHKEVAEIIAGVEENATDITPDEFQKVVDFIMTHLMQFADFLYGVPRFDADWFNKFYDKYEDELGMWSKLKAF